MKQAYIVFEIAAASDVNATTGKLRSTSLANCLTRIVGSDGRVVFVHIACQETGGDPSFLNQAVQKLSGLDGIVGSTLVTLKQNGD